MLMGKVISMAFMTRALLQNAIPPAPTSDCVASAMNLATPSDWPA